MAMPAWTDDRTSARQTGMTTELLAPARSGSRNTGSDAEAAKGSEAARSLYTMWHCEQYECLLYKLSGRPGRWPCLHGQMAGHSQGKPV